MMMTSSMAACCAKAGIGMAAPEALATAKAFLLKGQGDFAFFTDLAGTTDPPNTHQLSAWHNASLRHANRGHPE